MHRDIDQDLKTNTAQFDKLKNYWLKKFSGELVKSSFPYDHKEMGLTAYYKSEFEFKIPSESVSKLNHLSNNSDHNLFVILTAGLTLLLSRYTGNNDIIIGSPILKQGKETNGEFLNSLLPIRNKLTPGMTIKDLLVQIKSTFKEANENSNYPLQRLLHHLGLPSVENGFPLFETVIMLQNIHHKATIDQKNHNLVFCFHRHEQNIEGTIQYNSALYRKENLEHTASLLGNLLKNCLEDLNTSVFGVEILSEEERHKLIEIFNDTDAPFAVEKRWVELFEDQVKKTPDNRAIIAGDDHFDEATTLTYNQLNEKANQLARLLMKKGVGPDVITAITVKPSLEMGVGILSILKAGGGYLPFDHESPEDRMAYLLKDSECRILLSDNEGKDHKKFNGERINLENQEIYTGETSNLERRGSSTDLFYTIYTSGTTGRPKGAILVNRNIVNYITWFSRAISITDKDKTILTSSFAFDLGYTTFLSPLFSGGQLHLIPKDVYINSELLLAYIKTKGITFMKMTPSLFSVLVKSPTFSMDTCSTLRLVVLGGEEINIQDVERVRQICNHLEVMNHYGPTETTIGAVARFIDFQEYAGYKKNPSIGKPIHNTKNYILDTHFHVVPTGIPGELYIGGEGVARGYLNNQELTSEKFISDPFLLPQTNRGLISRLYVTGDMARWLKDGNIQFLGRKDNQVKIRGYRVEIGETENQVLKYPEVKDVVVLAIEDKGGGKILCAYIVPTSTEKSIEIGPLKEFLATILPDFMIPTHFVFLDKIPLTPNGKVDRKELHKIEILISGNEYTPPENENQAKMIQIWSEVLEVEKEKIGIHTNFFELGGHSLKVMLLVSKIHKNFNAKISMVDVFSAPSPAGLTQFIKEKDTREQYTSIEPQEKKEYYALSSPQRRFYLAQQLNQENIAYNISGTLVLTSDLDEENLKTIFLGLIRRHESLRTSFKIIDNEPVQIIHDKVDFKIDIHIVQRDDLDKTMKKLIKPFNLNTTPLFRIALIKTGQEKVLLVDMHHIISDGISLQILSKDFIDLAENKQLHPLPVQYKEYALWQMKMIEEKSLNIMEKYWLDTLENFKITRLPGDNLNHDQPGKGDFEIGTVENKTYTLIDRFCTQYKLTIFSFMLSIYLLVLSRETDENDITIGVPVDNREHLDVENIIGVFLNVFLLRAKIDPEDTIKNNILNINKAVIDGLANGTYPYEELYYKVKNRNQLAEEELFTILFNYLPVRNEKETGLIGSETVPLVPLEIIPKYPVTIYIKDNGEKLDINLVYRNDHYSKKRINRIIHNYSNFIEKTIINEDMSVSSLEYYDVEQSDSLKDFSEEFDNEDLFN